MTLQCPACSAALPAGARFCAMCGSPLPSRTASALRERRLVSVLFCDLVGFTTFSEGRDHEDVRDVLEEYFGAARAAVAAHDGRIEKFIGDAVMAVWGVPIAREDDAERAVRTALAITDAVSELARRLAIPELEVRVGVLTGEAAVDIGAVDAGMVIGDSVNTASRIQSLAPPGGVLVDDTTYRMCSGRFAFSDAGAHLVKGKAEPVQTWQARRGGPDRAASGNHDASVVMPPFVGRQAELETIRQALATVVSDTPGLSVLTTIGEVGMGKSRLATELELMAMTAPTGAHFLRGQAASYGEGTGFQALAEMMRAAAGIGAEESTTSAREAVERLLGRVVGDRPERERVQAAVLRLLDLDDGAGQIERGELFSAWRLLLERLAAERPVVLVFDELQYADQAQLDFIAHLHEWAAGAPILVFAESRPDDRVEAIAALGSRLRLEPLTVAELGQLVAGAVRETPAALVDSIVTDGGGVPLYAIETLRALADQGVLVARDGRYVVHGELRQVDVPPTIRALVAARLDALAPEERRALLAGAVLGERFAAAGVAALTGLAVAVAEDLVARLSARAMVVVTGPGECEFSQGVVRRVALATLSRRERRRLHLAAADHLTVGEPAVVAGHLVIALEQGPASDSGAPELRRRAQEALIQAAERAVSVTLTEEALSHFDRAIGFSADESSRVALMERAAFVAQRGGRHDDAATRWDAVAGAHGAAGRERSRLGAVAQRLRAQRLSRPAADRLDELRAVDAGLAGTADAAAAQAALALAYALYQLGDNAAALQAGARGAQIARACGDAAMLGTALAYQGGALGELGRLTEAIEAYDRAVPLIAANEVSWLPDILGLRAVTLASAGRFVEAAAGARETIELAERHGLRLTERWARVVLGRALCSLGDDDAAIASIEAVRDTLPTTYSGMAVAPLVVIALRRDDLVGAHRLVIDYDTRRNAAVDGFDSDFRCLRAAVLAAAGADIPSLARVLPETQSVDLAEWSGWLGVVVDLLLTHAPAALAAAHAALDDDADPVRAVAPVRAQARRLEAWLAWRDGDTDRARTAWGLAESLARGCSMAHEAAAIAAERAGH